MEKELRFQIEQLVPLTDEEFTKVISYFKIRKFKKDQYLIQAGDLAPNEYFITSGLLKSSFTDETGKEHIFQFAMEQWWISDPQAFEHNQQATLDVTCLEELCADLKKMESFFRKKAQSGYIASQRRIIAMMSLNAKQRYDLFLEICPTLPSRISKTMIASYLGITRETLSRLASS
jgi:CRP-like cAMP-binding protein